MPSITHVHEIQQKIADLRRLQKALKLMAAKCSGGGAPECPIIDALFNPKQRLLLRRLRAPDIDRDR